MFLLDLFRVPWKNSNSDIRKKIARQKNPVALKWLAKNDKNPSIRAIAIGNLHLNDQALLIEIAKKDKESQVRAAAVGNPNLKDKEFLTEIAKYDSNDCVRYAAVKNPNLTNPDVLTYIIKNDRCSFVVQAAKGADVNARDSSGFTLLHRAAIWGDWFEARSLIPLGADVNALTTSDYKYVASHDSLSQTVIPAGSTSLDIALLIPHRGDSHAMLAVDLMEAGGVAHKHALSNIPYWFIPMMKKETERIRKQAIENDRKKRGVCIKCGKRLNFILRMGSEDQHKNCYIFTD